MRQNKASATNSKRDAPKAPKKISETYLHNSGLYYLQRFAASSKHFQSVMLRKVKKSCAFHADQDYAACAAMVEALTAKFVAAGLIDDEVYAKGVITSLRRRGKSKKAILVKMREKGIEEPLGLGELRALDEEQHTSEVQAEHRAALAHARKKRLGPFRTKEADPKKELSSMARAGFSYDTARRVLMIDAEDIEDF
jgi:regulatory protein